MLDKIVVSAFTACLLLSSCGGSKQSGNGFNGATKEELADLNIYKTDSPYADIAADCARAKTENEYCTFKELPLLGMESESPSIADVMNRLVVSHSWMGDHFEALLLRYPSEFLYLFRGITAIVIDDDIRPAYYTATTGAIYLDPAYLWLSNGDKATINQKSDFRSDYADPLIFRSVGRYIKDGEYAYSFAPLTGLEERGIEDIEYLMARLLLHELAHANDYFPYDSYNDINTNNTPAQSWGILRGAFVSDRLYRSSRLTSDKMHSLADVMYNGKNPTAEDIATTATEAGAAFESDTAADDYAYTSQYEDIAMLFEIAMMKYFWGIDYDTGFLAAPVEGCGELGWAQRNRIGDNNVKDRAQFVTNALMPHIDMTMFYQDLETAKDFVESSGWCLPADIAGEDNGNTSLQKPHHGHEHHPHMEVLKPYL